MPGTKSSGRPGGNPDIKKYAFKSDRDEPLRSRLQLRVSDSMKQQLDQQDDWQEFVRQAVSEKLQAVLKEGVSNLLEVELTDVETKISKGISNNLSNKEIAEMYGLSLKTIRCVVLVLHKKFKNEIEKEVSKRNFVPIIMEQSQQSPSKPLQPGIYTLECLGNLRKKGEQFFLNGITREGLVNLAPRVDSYFSGTIWEIIYNEAERIYQLKCLGRLNGVRLLNGKTAERELTLVPSAEEIGAENELSGTKWKVFPIPDEHHTFRFKCYGSNEEPFYLNGRTRSKTVTLLEQADVGRSGTRWKVEPASKAVLQKVGFENLELTHWRR